MGKRRRVFKQKPSAHVLKKSKVQCTQEKNQAANQLSQGVLETKRLARLSLVAKGKYDLGIIKREKPQKAVRFFADLLKAVGTSFEVEVEIRKIHARDDILRVIDCLELPE